MARGIDIARPTANAFSNASAVNTSPGLRSSHTISTIRRPVAAAERTAAHGRSLLGGFAQQGSPGEALARAVGATASLADIRRVLELGPPTAEKLPGLREEAGRAAVASGGSDTR